MHICTDIRISNYNLLSVCNGTFCMFSGLTVLLDNQGALLWIPQLPLLLCLGLWPDGLFPHPVWHACVCHSGSGSWLGGYAGDTLWMFLLTLSGNTISLQTP